jgi:hypothetical protein
MRSVVSIPNQFPGFPQPFAFQTTLKYRILKERKE